MALLSHLEREREMLLLLPHPLKTRRAFLETKLQSRQMPLQHGDLPLLRCCRLLGGERKLCLELSPGFFFFFERAREALRPLPQHQNLLIARAKLGLRCGRLGCWRSGCWRSGWAGNPARSRRSLWKNEKSGASGSFLLECIEKKRLDPPKERNFPIFSDFVTCAVVLWCYHRLRCLLDWLLFHTPATLALWRFSWPE